jgi:hypothetical protein
MKGDSKELSHVASHLSFAGKYVYNQTDIPNLAATKGHVGYRVIR